MRTGLDTRRSLWRILAANEGLFLLTILPGQASAQNSGQDQPARPKVVRPAEASETLQRITDDYNRKLLDLERERLMRLAQLASRQPAAGAATTYEELFRVAIANNLFREAERIAGQVASARFP